MFSRCASGSCDIVPLSVDDRARIVVDIGLRRRHAGFLREVPDSLVGSLRLRDNILHMSISVRFNHKQFHLTRWFGQLEVRLDIRTYIPRFELLIHKSAVWSDATLKRAGHN